MKIDCYTQDVMLVVDLNVSQCSAGVHLVIVA